MGELPLLEHRGGQGAQGLHPAGHEDKYGDLAHVGVPGLDLHHQVDAAGGEDHEGDEVGFEIAFGPAEQGHGPQCRQHQGAGEHGPVQVLEELVEGGVVLPHAGHGPAQGPVPPEGTLLAHRQVDEGSGKARVTWGLPRPGPG